MTNLVTRGLGGSAQLLVTSGLGAVPSADVDAPPYVKFWPPDIDAQYLAQALREDDELIIICQAFVEILRCR